MAVNLSPLGGVAGQFFDNNGVPLSGGLLYTYAAGTTTAQTTYTSSSGSIAQANPIVLDSAGRVPNEIWLTGGVSYKFVLKTSAAVLIGSWDNVSGINDLTNVQPTIYNSTGTGSLTTFTLSTSPKNINTTNVYISGIYQDKNTYSLSTSTITFSQAPPINSVIEVSYY
jgi:hypothetical protein